MERKGNQEVSQLVVEEGPIEKEEFSTMIWTISLYLVVTIQTSLTRKEKRRKQAQKVIEMIRGILKLLPRKIIVKRSQSKNQSHLKVKSRVAGQSQNQNLEGIRKILTLSSHQPK